MAMELRHFRYFKMVADEKHITRAAEKLDMQQPPLSLQIKGLETELGVQLFHRLARGVELTEAGRAFYKDVCHILESTEKAKAKAQRIARGELGSVAVGFTSSVIFHPSTKRAIQKFRDENVEINLNLVEDGSAELVKDVSENKLDVAFIRTNLTHIDNVRIHQLCDEEIVLALPLNHPLLEFDGAIDLAEIAPYPLILYRRSSGPGIYDRVVSALNREHLAPNIIQEAPRVSAALNLVAAGMGISFVPSSLCSSHTEDVRYRPMKIKPTLSASILLACRKNEGSVAVKDFIENSRIIFGSLIKKP